MASDTFSSNTRRGRQINSNDVSAPSCRVESGAKLWSFPSSRHRPRQPRQANPDTIKQFTQLANTVMWAEHSGDLRKAIQGGKKIIITTVHKFPFILDDISTSHRGNNFAIIIDEAHSSQSGNMSSKMNVALSGDYDPDADTEDKIISWWKAEDVPNAANSPLQQRPRAKTLEMFGVAVPQPTGW